MSFILDALKKSELERQRQTIPGLVDSGTVRPRARLPGWAIALCALLAVNLMVLSVVLIRGRTTVPPPTARPERSASADGGRASEPRGDTAAGASGGTDHFSPLDADPVYAPEIPVAGNSSATTPAMQVPAPPAGSPGGSGTRAPRRHDPVLTNDDYKATDEEVLPTIGEMSLTGGQALPELHLDVHVFATKAADRFVYINMRKYHEGATLQEGPTLERIRRDGVVLDYQGLRFLLPRQ